MSDNKSQECLPKVALDFIDAVVKKVRYRKKIRQEVREELTDHFYMALKDCVTDEGKQQVAEEVIEEFGDVKILASLIRRGKKRCRSLWMKTVVATMEVIGVLLLLVVLRVSYLAIGTPVISVDYVVWLNDFVRQGRDESLNANPYFEKAVVLSDIEAPESLKGILDERGAINGENIDDVRAYVAKMDPAFAALRQGAAKLYYWPVYQVGENEITSSMGLLSGLLDKRMPALSGIKKLAIRMGDLGVALKLYDGDIDGAISDSLVLLRLGQHMEGTGLLIEQLVGIAVAGKGYAHIIQIIDTENVSAELLLRCQKQLESFSEGRNLLVDFSSEKVFQLDYIQRTFTDDGTGGGRALLKGLPLAVKDFDDIVRGFVTGNYPDRRKAVASVESYFAESKRFVSIAPWQTKTEESDALTAKMTVDVNMQMKPIVQSFLQIRELSWRVMASHRSLIAVCGVLRYEKDKGEFPSDLQDVVKAGYIKGVPVDPYSGRPFVYKRTDGNFLLYSYGLDLDDDGASPYINPNGGKQRTWGRGDGDAVFWPVIR